MFSDAQPKPVVTVVGVGLIGGSIGQACRRFGLAAEVIGYDPDPAVLSDAVRIGAIDRALPFAEAIAAAGLVLIAAPVSVIPRLLAEAAPHLRPNTLVTDTGSTKRSIVAAASCLPAEVVFLGGHPMAGSENAGVLSSDPFLLQNAVYIVTPVPETPAWAVDQMRTFIAGMGSLPQVMDPVEHDHVVAAVSHLPHVAAAALVNSAARLLSDDRLLGFAAGGFRDTTRIASGHPALWRDILLSNRSEVSRSLGMFIDELDRFRTLLNTEGDRAVAELERALGSARATRQLIPTRQKGLLAPLYEMVVQIEDRPGAIADVAETLASCGVSIRNIEIVRLREGVGGSLKLGVDSPESLTESIEALRSRGFTAREVG